MTDKDPYLRCPDCQGDGDLTNIDPETNQMWIESCPLCRGIGNLKESDLRKRLPKEEADEILDLYYRRGVFKDLKQTISPFVKGYDA